MERHFQKEILRLNSLLIKMGSVTETAIEKAVQAVLQRDGDLARLVIEGDGPINAFEMEIDQVIIDLLALQQPVASDLRLILAAQKINNDLERIGDHAVNLAESALTLSQRGEVSSYLSIPKMATMAREMLRNALDGFVHRNPELAHQVLRADDTIDDLNRETARLVIDMIKANQHDLEAGLDLIRISRNLERVADLATNIAEEVIFVAHARMVKHHAADL